MNEEEKKALAFLRFYVSDDEDEYFDRDYYIDKNIIETILNLIEKQQKEIENYQILKDDIEEHNIAYVDTPEFEEKYISKDKIRDIIFEFIPKSNHEVELRTKIIKLLGE